MHLTDLAEIFRASSFKMFRGALDAGGAVKAINAKGFASLTIGQSDELTAMAKQYGAKGLAFIKVENGEWKSPIVKFFTEAEKEALRSKLQVEEGDLILFAADKWEIVCEVLGRIRSRIAEMQKLTAGSSQLDFLWVTDFPLMAFSAEENKWNAVHHPFTRPKAEDIAKLEAEKFGEVRAEAYDVVLNGVELGGGSIRIHEPELQAKIFAALGVSEEDQQSMFGHMLRAFRLGAPPHGGIALGLDRMVMLICGEESIREVMAFPKNNRGLDLMSQLAERGRSAPAAGSWGSSWRAKSHRPRALDALVQRRGRPDVRLGGGNLAWGRSKQNAEGEGDDAADEDKPGPGDLRPPIGHEAAELDGRAEERAARSCTGRAPPATPRSMPMMFVLSAPRVRVSMPTRKTPRSAP